MQISRKSRSRAVVKKMSARERGHGITNGHQVLLAVKIGDMRQKITELKRTKWHGIVRYEQER